MKILQQSGRLLVAQGIVLLCSVALVQFPLLNYLGFEFSVVIAVLLAWIIGFITIASVREKIRYAGAIINEGWSATRRDLIRNGTILLLIPLLIATLNVLRVKNCAYLEGVLYYLLIPTVTVVWCSGLALCCVFLFRGAMTMYSLILLCVLLYAVYLGYATPQIHTYNFIYGYFPGLTYDESLRITPTLVLFRVVTLAMAVFFFLIAALLVRNSIGGETLRRRVTAFSALARLSIPNFGIIGLGLALVIVWIFRVELGFETTASHLQRVLGSRLETEHFRIYYAPESVDEREIRYIAAMHEFRFEQVRAALQVRFTERIDSYIYPDDKTKGRLIGAGRTNVAKPWRVEVHLNKDAWEGTLKHELVHVLAGEFGMPIIRAHYNIGLVEGLATAVDGGFGNRTLHEYAAAMGKFGLVKRPERLINPTGFAMRASTVSYALMGSFCQYLINRYGMLRFKDLYRGKTPTSVYDQSYEELVDEWQQSLQRIEVPEEWRQHVLFLFNRPSIFAKECVRVIANINETGYDSLARKRPLAAAGLFSEALELSWNTESYAGLIRASYQSSRYDSVIQFVATQLGDTAGRSSIINLFLLYGDALWQRGEVAQAQQAYEDLRSLNISDRLDEALALRLHSLRDRELSAALRSYFTDSPSDSVALQMLTELQARSHDPIIGYLKGRAHFAMKDYASGINQLENISLPTDLPILKAGRERLLGESYFRLAQYQKALSHFWQALNHVDNQASVDRIQDALSRSEWFERNGIRYLGAR